MAVSTVGVKPVKPAEAPEGMVSPSEFEAVLKSAMKTLRKEGVLAYLNVQGCCRGCVDTVKAFGKTEAEIGDKPLIWHYGGQGGRVQFGTDGPIYASSGWGEKAVSTLYFSHQGEGADAKAIEVFRAAGLNAYGGGYQTVMVDAPAPVSPEVKVYWAAVADAEYQADLAKGRVARIKREIAALQEALGEAEGAAIDAEIAVSVVGTPLAD